MSLHQPQRPPGREPAPTPSPGTRERNRRVLVSLALVGTLIVLVASYLPPVLVLPAASSFLFYAGLGAMLIALVRGESWRDRCLTGWDQAALLLAVALFTGYFGDHEAAREYLEVQRALAGRAGEG